MRNKTYQHMGFLVNSDDMGSLSDTLSDLWAKNQDKLIEAGEKGASDYIENNSDKLMNIAYGLADSLVGDTEEGKAKIAELTKVAVATGTQEAQGSMTQMVADNKWLIIGGVMASMLVFGAVGYGFSTLAVKNSQR